MYILPMFLLQVEILMPDAATYSDYVDSTNSNMMQLNRNVCSNIGKAQERQRTQFRDKKSVEGERATFKEGQFILLCNSRKRGQKGKTFEKKWLLPTRKILKIGRKTALLQGMKGKVNVQNLKHMPERNVNDSFVDEHSFNEEENTCHSFTISATTNVVRAQERNTIKIENECSKDEDELALINNGTSSTIIRCIDNHFGEKKVF